MRLSVGLCAVTLTAVALACTDLTGPVADLNTIGSDLTLIDGVLASPIPWSAGWAWYGLHLPAPDSGSPLIPDSLRGRTFALNCATLSYVLTPDTGAPATGVRVVLYQRDAGGSVQCPPIAVGHFDLFDVSTPGVPAIHAVAADLAEDPPVIDYTMTRTRSGQAATTGFVSDGLHRLDLDLLTSDSLRFRPVSHWLVDVEGTGIHESLSDTIFQGVDTYEDDLDFLISDGPIAAEVVGGFGVFNVSSFWSGKVSVDAAPFARISGTRDAPAFAPATPTVRFTSTQRLLLTQVLNEPATLHARIGGIVAVAAQVLPR